jgi:hypothetical protein
MPALCKSYRIFHKESNKIRFVFFWFFYDFLRIFKVSAKALYHLRLSFTGRPLELSFLLQTGPWFTKKTLERMREMQCSPWAWRAARLAGIGRLRWRPWPGKGWERTRGSPTVNLWPQMGGGAPVAGRSVAYCEHGCGGLCSGELPTWDMPRAARWVPIGLGRLRKGWACGERPEKRAPRWGAQAGRRHACPRNGRLQPL